MLRPKPSNSVAIAAVLGLIAGCRASGSTTGPEPAEPEPAPLRAGASRAAASSEEPPAATDSPASDLVAAVDSPWAYLAATYDADRNGTISFEEHGRGRQSFERLDRDGDGVLGAADFEAAPAGSPSRTAVLVTVARYLQDDDDPLALDVDELDEAITVVDANGDDRVDREELTAVLEERARAGVPLEGAMARMMARRDPWETLVGAIDGDRDGALGRTELVSFFQDADGDGDDRWDLAALIGRGAPARERSAGDAPAHDGLAAQVGQVAPDFTLGDAGGELEVTLSDFIGDRPVALIFGSYT